MLVAQHNCVSNYVCFDDVYDELVAPKSCYICFDDIDDENRTIGICSNPKCSGKICKSCVKKTYFISDDYKGQIDKFKVACSCCNESIDPTTLGISPFVRSLFKPTNYKMDDKIITNSAAQMLLDGHRMWRCDSTICRDSDDTKTSQMQGIFYAPKLACADGERENNNNNQNAEKEMRICPKCDEYETKNNIGIWRSFGFIISGDEMFRACPGGCGKAYTRTADSCPRLQCTDKKCGVHFCYCCGDKFATWNDVYTHLNKVYKKNYPTIEEIKNYLTKRNTIKEWRKGLPEDFTDEEIEAMIG